MLISPPKLIREMFNSDEEYEKANQDWNEQFNSTVAMYSVPIVFMFIATLYGAVSVFGATKVALVVPGYALLHYVTYKAIKLVLTKLEGK